MDAGHQRGSAPCLWDSWGGLGLSSLGQESGFVLFPSHTAHSYREVTANPVPPPPIQRPFLNGRRPAMRLHRALPEQLLLDCNKWLITIPSEQTSLQQPVGALELTGLSECRGAWQEPDRALCVCVCTRVYRGTLGLLGHLLPPKMHLHGDISEKVSRDGARETVAQTAAGKSRLFGVFSVF